MPETRLIDANAAMDDTTLFDWYISSVSEDDTPVWTREHIDELMRDFLVIPINAPTVDAVPVKRGKWITTQKAIDDGFTTCSYCHREFYIDDLVKVGNENGYCEFCPSCGADMRGGTDA